MIGNDFRAADHVDFSRDPAEASDVQLLHQFDGVINFDTDVASSVEKWVDLTRLTSTRWPLQTALPQSNDTIWLGLLVNRSCYLTNGFGSNLDCRKSAVMQDHC